MRNRVVEAAARRQRVLETRTVLCVWRDTGRSARAACGSCTGQTPLWAASRGRIGGTPAHLHGQRQRPSAQSKQCALRGIALSSLSPDAPRQVLWRPRRELADRRQAAAVRATSVSGLAASVARGAWSRVDAFTIAYGRPESHKIEHPCSNSGFLRSTRPVRVPRLTRQGAQWDGSLLTADGVHPVVDPPRCRR